MKVSGALPILVAARSDVGMVRDHNEDCFLVTFEDAVEPELMAQRGRLFVVADGMGGAAAGERASQLVVETIKEQYYFGPMVDGPLGASLQAALEAANARVHSEAVMNPELKGMGSTCTALLVAQNEVWFAHVGDTRLYLVRDRKMLQLTDDHSKVAQMVRDGFLTEEQAESHPEKNVLQRSIGPKPTVEVDASIRAVEVRDGDRLVLCSDGLTNHVRDAEIAEIVDTMPGTKAVDALIDLAKNRGGTDNITVVLVHIGTERPSRRPPPTEEPPAPPTQIFEQPPVRPKAKAKAKAKARARPGVFTLVVIAVLFAALGAGAALLLMEDDATPSEPDLPIEVEPARPAEPVPVKTPPAVPERAQSDETRRAREVDATAVKCLRVYMTLEKKDSVCMCPAAMKEFILTMHKRLGLDGDAGKRYAKLAESAEDGGLLERLERGESGGPEETEWLRSLIRDIKRFQRRLVSEEESDGCPEKGTFAQLDNLDLEVLCPATGVPACKGKGKGGAKARAKAARAKAKPAKAKAKATKAEAARAATTPSSGGSPAPDAGTAARDARASPSPSPAGPGGTTSPP